VGEAAEGSTVKLTEWQRARTPICDFFFGRCDASCFPTASGVNPMDSTEAIAHLNASRLAAPL
jgi:hypothetical protein